MRLEINLKTNQNYNAENFVDILSIFKFKFNL